MEARIPRISLNLVFKKLADPNAEEGFEDVFVQTVEFAEGSQTAPLTVRAQKGYTGDPPQTRAEILRHSHVPRHAGRHLCQAELGRLGRAAAFDIPRVLLTK